jgi:hypothetical protein
MDSLTSVILTPVFTAVLLLLSNGTDALNAKLLELAVLIARRHRDQPYRRRRNDNGQGVG